jgi:hypothetical protein
MASSGMLHCVALVRTIPEEVILHSHHRENLKSDINYYKLNAVTQTYLILKLVIGHNLFDNLKIFLFTVHINMILFTYCLPIFNNDEEPNNCYCQEL